MSANRGDRSVPDDMEHLSASDVAAYLENALDDRARVEAHLLECSSCRAELVEVADITSRVFRQRQRRIWLPALAAAALLIVLVRPTGEPDRVHREPPVTSVVAPQAIVPAGVVDSASTFLWTSVPGADRYVVRVYSATGSVLWQRELQDTVAQPPDSLRLVPGVRHYWKVEAHVGFDRATASELTEFSVRQRAGRR